MEQMNTGSGTATGQPAATPSVTPSAAPQTAVHAAVASGDTKAFRAARLAERVGKPLSDVAASASDQTVDVESPSGATGEPATPAATGQPEALTAKQRRERDADDRLRQRVADAVSVKDAEIAELRRQLTQPTPPRREPAAAEPPKTFTEAIKAPDVSRDMLTEEQFFEQFPEAPLSAYTRYAVSYDGAAERAAAQRTSDETQLTAAQQARADSFYQRVNAAKLADPTFAAKVSAEVRELRPFGALLPGQVGGPASVIAENLYDSPVVDKLMVHFSEHPEELRRLQQIPPEIAAWPEAARTRAHIQLIVREIGKLEGRFASGAASTAAPAAPAPKTISDAPEAATTLGTRPHVAGDVKTVAIRKGDTGAYRELRRAERAAAMRR